jgi:hypothetical protein
LDNSSGFFSETASTMTDHERLHENAVCDLLMKQGIDGRQDEDAGEARVISVAHCHF